MERPNYKINAFYIRTFQADYHKGKYLLQCALVFPYFCVVNVNLIENTVIDQLIFHLIHKRFLQAK